MKYNTMKNFLKSTTVIILAVVIVAGIAYAGSLTPPSSPISAQSYTLSDLYNKVTNINYSATSHTVSTTSSPASSFYTLTDIYGKLNSESSRVIPSNIRNNVTIFGVTGTMTDGTTPTQLAWSNTFYNPNLPPGGFQGGLCWSASYCDSRTGYMNNGVLIGAKEYCSYLNQAGDTLTNSINDYWRLPTKLELYNELTRLMVIEPNLDELHNRFYASGFGSFRYWSSTEGDPYVSNGVSIRRAWRIGSSMRITPDDVSLSLVDKPGNVICVH